MSETPTPTTGSIANFFINFTPEVQIMIISVVLVFFMLSAWVLLRRRKRGF